MKFFEGKDAKSGKPVRVSEVHLKRWPEDVTDPVEVGTKAPAAAEAEPSAAAEEPTVTRRSRGKDKE